jgi:signal transduction histidine kinase
LTNAIKHAAAKQVSVALAVRAGRLEIIVTDDGSGLRATAAAGFGLRSLQDRVAALDGTVTVQSLPDRGTTLRAEFACG